MTNWLRASAKPTFQTDALAGQNRCDFSDGCPCGAEPMCKDRDCVILQAADAIEELQADKTALNGTVTNLLEQIKDLGKPRWIPVNERLPEEHVFVLIRQDDDRMMVAERVDGDWWYRYFAYDVDRWDEDEQGTITHWMPLPQPPEEE